MRSVFRNIVYFLFFVGMVVVFTGCQKDYYQDSGIHDPHYKGTIMDYLKSRPDIFDTLVQVIQIAGMEDVFEKDEVTFFAPADSSIRLSLEFLNMILYQEGVDTVSRLNQISPDVWRSELSMYVFKGTHLLNDYPQLDLSEIPVFPGQSYPSYGGRTMNIGVIYNDAAGVQYAGYRQLVISYIPSMAAPQSGWLNAEVASSDIQPTNGALHVLRFSSHFFGFDVSDFIQNAVDQGIAKP